MTNSVHVENGKWYFWDETWADRLGPYLTEKEARDALADYHAYYLGVSNLEREVMMQSHDIMKARRVIRDAFAADPAFKRTYVANIAMRILYDHLHMDNRELRNKIAEECLDLIFEDSPGEGCKVAENRSWLKLIREKLFKAGGKSDQ